MNGSDARIHYTAHSPFSLWCICRSLQQVMTIPLLVRPTDVPVPVGAIEKPARDPLLEASYSSITKEELDFVSEQTGIKDKDTLRQHILQVQAEAFSVHPYPCIKRFAFIK